ncbi:hypothetical protein D3C87_976690 [compost metagenome]
MKYCEVGEHEVNQLWKAKRTNKNTGEVIQLACCKDCVGREPIKSKTKQKDNTKELNVFFAEASLVFPKYCENCGEKLLNTGSFTRRSQTCHILPKTASGGFPSVAIHPANKVFMCCFTGCYGHGNWDNQDAAKRKTMPVYKKALERFREFEKELTEPERNKAYKYLGIEGR